MPEMGETVVKNLPRSTIEDFKKVNRMKQAAMEMLTHAREEDSQLWRSVAEEYDLELDFSVYKVEIEDRSIIYVRRRFPFDEE